MDLLLMAADMLVQWWPMFIVLWCMEASFCIPLMSRAPRARWAGKLTKISIQKVVVLVKKTQLQFFSLLFILSLLAPPSSWGCCMNATPWRSSWSRPEAWPPLGPWTSLTSSPPPSTSGFPWSWDPPMMCRSTSPSVRSTRNEVCFRNAQKLRNVWENTHCYLFISIIFLVSYSTGPTAQDAHQDVHCKVLSTSFLDGNDQGSRKLSGPTVSAPNFINPILSVKVAFVEPYSVFFKIKTNENTPAVIHHIYVGVLLDVKKTNQNKTY